MRVLLMTTPVTTHMAPIVPLAWALRAAGHDVLAAGQQDVLGAAHGAGLSGVAIGEPFHVNDLMTGDLPDGIRAVEVLGRPDTAALAAGARVWLMHSRYTAAESLAFARQWRPDLIVSDRLEFSALIVGGVLNVPTVQHRWGVDSIATAAWEPARRALGGICRRMGLDGGLPDPAMILDPCPPGLQDPAVAAGRPIRFIPYNGTGLVPPWARERSRSKRVCVSLGRLTLATNGMPLLRHVLAAFDGLHDVEAVITVDTDFHDQIGPVPDTVRIVEPIPLNLFMESCDAVIHHGGSGTELTATAFGLPQLVLPQTLDCFVVGDRIAACGAGITIEDAADQNSPTMIRDAVMNLLTGPGYRKGACELQDAMAAMPAPAELVEPLEQLAAGRPEH
jgi:UDP:flavonoid glycosyltransferase YjiC (YdhE family)